MPLLANAQNQPPGKATMSLATNQLNSHGFRLPPDPPPLALHPSRWHVALAVARPRADRHHPAPLRCRDYRSGKAAVGCAHLGSTASGFHVRRRLVLAIGRWSLARRSPSCLVTAAGYGSLTHND